MANDEFRYVKFYGEEKVLAKTDLLSMQMNLLKILKAVKGYHAERLRELKIKSALLSRIKEVNQNVKKIQLNIPKLTTSRSFVRERESGKVEIRERKELVKPGEDRSLERELREIQDKLNAIRL